MAAHMGVRTFSGAGRCCANRHGARLRTLVLLLAAVVAVACAPRDADLRRQRLATEKRNLEATLDRLEERLLASQARVRFWRELRDRHESVSAIACVSQDEHAREMAARALPALERQRSALHRSRVAAAAPAEAGVRIPASSSR
jgi:hypothetical protein